MIFAPAAKATFEQIWARGRVLSRAFLWVGLGLVLITAVLHAPFRVAAHQFPHPSFKIASRQVITSTLPGQLYLPILMRPRSPTPLPPPIPYFGSPPLNLALIRAELQAMGLELAFSKIGFHAGPGGNPDDLDEFLYQLDAAGVPFTVKSVDSLTGVAAAQQIMVSSTLPHIAIYRRSLPYDNPDYPPDYNPDVPNYAQSPILAAHQHWVYHRDGFPPALNPTMTWVETVNEVDKNRAEWLGQFALETARLALADGYKWAAFGWATGEPEPEHWQTPAMLEFLRLAGENPDRLAIAVHEYSLTVDQIGNAYPYLVGRFQFLFAICDAHNIPRPTVLITEWGWEPTTVPTVTEALDDMRWASWLYAAYPQVKGVALWYLGPGFGGIADQAQLLIEPLGAYAVAHYFGMTPGLGRIEPGLFTPQCCTAFPPTQRQMRGEP